MSGTVCYELQDHQLGGAVIGKHNHYTAMDLSLESHHQMERLCFSLLVCSTRANTYFPMVYDVAITLVIDVC